MQREYVLQKLLAPIASRYDVILIDTLPYLGVLVVNALVAGRTMTGYKGTRVVGLPHDRVQSILKRHGVLKTP